MTEWRDIPSFPGYGTCSENVRDSVAHGTQRNTRKTHCPHGHPYDEHNTTYEAAGNRKCRTCKRIRERERRAAARKKETAA